MLTTNVFILTTGRTGSLTFHKACRYINNYSSAHESKAGSLKNKLSYPDYHIEIDNRLSFFLPSLSRLYPDAFYVHLVRSHTAVVDSFMKRRGVIDAWAAVNQVSLKDYPKRELVEHYVEHTNHKIECFLKDKPHLLFPIEEAKELWPFFWRRISAKGDFVFSLAEFENKYNGS